MTYYDSELFVLPMLWVYGHVGLTVRGSSLYGPRAVRLKPLCPNHGIIIHKITILNII